MSKIKEFVDARFYELSLRDEDKTDEFPEIIHGLADLKVTTRVDGIAGYYLDELAERLEMSRSKLAATLLATAIREAAKAANFKELDWEAVAKWGENNGLMRDARKEQE